MTIPNGKCVTKLKVWGAHDRAFAMQFEYNDHTLSEVLGRAYDHGHETLTPKQGGGRDDVKCLVGFRMRAGGAIDALGPIW